MKTKILTLALLSIVSITSVFAQDRTTVTANNSEISDNLDLRAVASIFGDSKDLADFERRLNNPEVPISNLDLNGDSQVDYLRVIETVEGNAHLIVIQSVLGRDTFQDIATVEVEKDRNNRIQVQVVGNVFMYGNNYIYEPVYSFTPVIYSNFWVSNYRPYWSTWYWGYYPSYYYAWNPFPIFRYRSHIGLHINVHHHYNYVNVRRCQNIYNNYYNGGRRGSAYEVQHPNRSFAVRNANYSNRHELDQRRNVRTVSQRGELATRNTAISGRNNAVRNETGRNTIATRENTVSRNETVTSRNNSVRTESATRDNSSRNDVREIIPTRNNSISRSETVTSRNNSISRSETATPRNNSISRSETATPRSNSNRVESTRNETPRNLSQRSESNRSSELQRSSSGNRNLSENRVNPIRKQENSERSQGNSTGNRRG
jgi:hypothetical protein